MNICSFFAAKKSCFAIGWSRKVRDPSLIRPGQSASLALQTWITIHFTEEKESWFLSGWADKWGIPHLSAQANHRKIWESGTRHARVLCSLPETYNWIGEASSTMAPCTTRTCVHELQQGLASHTLPWHSFNTRWHYMTWHIDMLPPMVVYHVQHGLYSLCYYKI